MENCEYFEKFKALISRASKPLFFWGASLFLEEFLTNCDCSEYNILGIIDKNPDRWGTRFCNYEIFSPSILEKSQEVEIISAIRSHHVINHSLLEIEIKNYQHARLLPDAFNFSGDELFQRTSTIITNCRSALNQNLKIITLEEKLLEGKDKIIAQNEELKYAAIFNNLLSSCNWIKEKDFLPTDGAASYSLLYLLYCILEHIKPQNILELGLGQTSKLTSQYVAYKNQSAKLQIIEHDKGWIEFFKPQVIENPNTEIVERELETFEFEEITNDKYARLEEVTNGQKYNLIIIDGPVGYKKNMPRTNILDLIPNNLADDFIIVFDDTERDGEKNTLERLFGKLDKSGIKYEFKHKRAAKHQTIITSESNRYATFF